MTQPSHCQPQILASTSLPFFLRANGRNEEKLLLQSSVEHFNNNLILRGQPYLNLRMWQSVKASVSSIIIQTDIIQPTDPLKRLPLGYVARRQVVIHRRTFLAPTGARRGL